MKDLITTILHTMIDALFPISKAESELLEMSPRDAYDKLPKSVVMPVPNTYSIFSYKDERVSKMIWSIKYKRSKKATEIGSFALYNKIKEITSGYDCGQNKIQNILILPIPITKRRRKERGYNQCDIILDEIERLNMIEKNNSHIIFEKKLLERIHHTSRQTLKNRADRLDSAKNIFGLNRETTKKYSDIITVSLTDRDPPTPPKTNTLIIIIDDVITTGSTMTDAMNTLQDMSLCNVIGVSIAH